MTTSDIIIHKDDTITDEQIIKAFEHCKSDECDNCPSLCDGDGVCLTPDIDKQLLSIVIKHQKENEELRSDKIIAETHERAARDLFVDCTRQLEEAKAEIERLKKNMDGLNIFTTNRIRLQAIKEFAERLKEKLRWNIEFNNKFVFESDIDKLVKEMTEE